MAKFKVYYAKTPPKSRVKSPSGVVFSYRWPHIAKMIQEIRDKANAHSMSVGFFKPGEYEITGVCVSDEEVTFYLEGIKDATSTKKRKLHRSNPGKRNIKSSCLRLSRV